MRMAIWKLTLILAIHWMAAQTQTMLISTTFAQTESPVDRRTSLQTITTDVQLADGPSWDGWSLMIPDVKAGKLLRYIPKRNEMQTFASGIGKVSATYLNHGRLYLSENGLSRIGFLDGRKSAAIARFESLDSVSSKGQKKPRPYKPNDLVVDRSGGIYVTFTSQNRVVYVAPNGQLKVAVDGIDSPNGITLSPDEKTLYVASFIPKKIWAYPVTDPGVTDQGKQIAAMDPGPSRGADGMAVDRAGNIYCAGPADIWIWSPSGKLLDKIACPTKPINCTFGDQDMRSLYITGPGAIYRQRMKISGRSPTPPSLSLVPVAKAQPKVRTEIPSTKIPGEIQADLDVVYAQYGERKMLMDIFRPQSASDKNRLPCLMVIHGGGWHNGDKTKFRALSIKLAELGYVVSAVEYRLADEAAFPAAIEDCLGAVRFMRAHRDRYFITNKVGAIGGSAGGHLTGLMAAGGGNSELIGDGKYQDYSSRIQASIVMAGPMEMLTGSVAERSTRGKNSNATSWLRGPIEEKRELYQLADAMQQIDKNTCPILFMVGEFDQPERNQPSREKLTKLGIETGVKTYKDGKHGCWNRLPWIDQMVPDMDKFMARHLK